MVPCDHVPVTCPHPILRSSTAASCQPGLPALPCCAQHCSLSAVQAASSPAHQEARHSTRPATPTRHHTPHSARDKLPRDRINALTCPRQTCKWCKYCVHAMQPHGLLDCQQHQPTALLVGQSERTDVHSRRHNNTCRLITPLEAKTNDWAPCGTTFSHHRCPSLDGVV